MNKPKPRQARVKITRTVTEIAIVRLDREGNIEEVEDICDELDYEVTELHSINDVLSVYS